MRDNELYHFKTITFRKNGEPDRCYWYSSRNGRAMQFAYCFGMPDLNIQPYAFDLGRHSPEPMYEGEKLFSETCCVLGGKCYYDGTSLGADRFAELVGIRYEVDDKLIFEMLDHEFEEWFAGHEKSPLAQLHEAVAETEEN